MKRVWTAVLCLLILASCCMSVDAAGTAVTDTFTHWTLAGGEKKAVPMPPVYTVADVVTYRSLGVSDDCGNMVDIDCDDSGNTYILTDNSHIVCFDKSLKPVRDYTVTDAAGEEVDFSGAKGIFVNDEHSFYIADTNHGRVLYVEDGVVRQEIVLPESSLIPSDFVFQPSGVAKDSKGYLYVISDGSYYGAILYDPDGVFVGFYGANSVEGNVLTTLANLWDRLTMNDEKRAKIKKTLPYQFTDIYIDNSDFVYTCTAKTESGSVGQMKMLSPGGTNILPGAESRNFGESDQVKRLGNKIKQNFTCIRADGAGFLYALDATYGLVYVYDTNATMMAAFGGGRGLGRQRGVFSIACSMALSGTRLLVADSLKNSVTVFERTAYGELLVQAQRLTMDADYLKAEPLWQQVLQEDATSRLALCGLSKAAYSRGEYREAMRYAKEGHDAGLYSQALAKVNNAFISDHFIWLFLLAIAVLAGLTALIVITRKRQIVLIPHEGIRTLFNCMVHPFQSFGEIKYKKTGSIRIAIVLTLLFFLTGALSVRWSDFRYTTFDASTYNAVFQFIRTVGLVLLWTVANWAFSTLQQGKGRLKEVFIVSAYSTLPLILYNVVSTALTHLLSTQNSALLSGLHTLALIFTGIMLCVGLMLIHDFSFPRFVFSAIVSVIFMILIVFVLFMVGMLISQFASFVGSIVLEAIRWG